MVAKQAPHVLIIGVPAVSFQRIERLRCIALTTPAGRHVQLSFALVMYFYIRAKILGSNYPHPPLCCRVDILVSVFLFPPRTKTANWDFNPLVLTWIGLQCWETIVMTKIEGREERWEDNVCLQCRRHYKVHQRRPLNFVLYFENPMIWINFP